jgi:hypothetical protein
MAVKTASATITRKVDFTTALVVVPLVCVWNFECSSCLGSRASRAFPFVRLRNFLEAHTEGSILNMPKASTIARRGPGRCRMTVAYSGAIDA